MNIRKIGAVAIVALSLGLAPPGHAQDNSIDSYANTVLDPIILANTDMIAQLEEYKNRKLQTEFVEADSRIEYAISTVVVPTSHPQWGSFRTNGFNDAWAQVQTQFVRTQTNAIETALIRSLYEDASGNPPVYTPEGYTGNDALDEFIDKSGAYAEARLDQALRGVGVDPKEYERADRKQRKQLLSSLIQRESMIQAFGKLSGLWQLKTFSKTTTSGDTVIGVVGVYSPRFEQIGQQILRGETIVDISRAGKPINERLNLSDEQLVEQFGLRVLYDDKGQAVLVSFGHSELPRKGMSRATVSSRMSSAIDEARTMADAQIAEFLNGTTNFNNRSIVGQSVVEFMDVGRDGYVEEGQNIELTRILEGLSDSRAKAKLGGLSDYRTWVTPHPKTGHTMVGVVRVWTREASDAARLIRNGPNDPSIASPDELDGNSSQQQTDAWESESIDL